MTHIDNRRGGRARNRRAEVLQAALELFAERGYRGTSLALVAERVGITQQGLLHYFPSKEKLLVEVLRLRDEADSRHFFEGAPPTTAAQLSALVAHNATRAGLVQAYTVLSAESVTDGHPAKDYFTQRYAQARAAGENWAADALGGRLPAGLTAPETVALLFAMMDGLQLQWLLSPDDIDMPKIFDAAIRLLVPAIDGEHD